MNAATSEPVPHSRSMGYIPGLDGIRAVAVIAVLIFHVWPSVLTGGFMGVDVFFVLSGFLITSILLHDMRDKKFSVKEFYLRRVQRLLPNLMFMILTVSVIWKLLLPVSTAKQAGEHGLWALFSFSNVYIWQNVGGYWADSATWAPLTHTWSLGIEEQFYMAFPIALLVLARIVPRWVRSILVTGTVFGFALCLYGTYTHPTANFYLLPTRLWELLIGTALAAHRIPLHSKEYRSFGILSRLPELTGCIGLGMILAGYFLVDEEAHFPGYVSLLPTLGTVVLITAVLDGKTRVAKFLSLPAMTYIGRISYSLYLWHWPFIILGKYYAAFLGGNRDLYAAVGCLVGCVLAVVAYYGIEQRLRKRGDGRQKRLLFVAASVPTIAVVLAFIGATPRPAIPDPRFDTTSFSGPAFDAGDPRLFDATSIVFHDVAIPELPEDAKATWRDGGVIHLYGKPTPQLVVLGSSHANMYSPLIDDICREAGISVAFLAVSQGSSILFEPQISLNIPNFQVSQEFNESRLKYLAEWQPDAVLAIERWELNSKSDEMFEEQIGKFLDQLRPHTDHVLFVTQVPALAFGQQLNLREYMAMRARFSSDLPVIQPNQGEALRQSLVQSILKMAASDPKLTVLRPDLSFYRPDGSVYYCEGRKFFYVDEDHLSDAGTNHVRSVFEEAIRAAIQPTTDTGTQPAPEPPTPE